MKPKKSSGSRRDDPGKASEKASKASEKSTKAAAEKVAAEKRAKATVEDLKAAIAAVVETPASVSAWDEAENLVGQLQKPDDLADAYRKVIKPGLDIDLVTSLGQRALRFFEEWYAGETDRVVEFLREVLVVDPNADWALERVTIVLSVHQRWDEVLVTYDQALSSVAEPARRLRLLQEAAGVASDADMPDKAIGYLQELFNQSPAAPDTAASLERLLEQHGRWQALVDVLRIRLPLLPGPESDETRLRLALLCGEKLGQPEQALDEVERILANNRVSDDTQACAVVERVLTNAEVSSATRARALDILRTRHTLKNRPERLVAALKSALSFADSTGRQALVREIAELHYRHGDLAAAREQMVEMLAMEPNDTALRVRLKYLAEVTEAPQAYRRGLLAAAEATLDAKLRVAYWLEAAQIGDESASDAVGLYHKVIDDGAAQPAQVLIALRRLTQLLQGESVAAERLTVLEKLATLESLAGVRRGLLGEAGRIAAERGEIERAIALWEKRLQVDDRDRKALDTLADLLSSAGRWADFAGLLRRRIAVNFSPAQKRADLLRLAEVQNTKLGEPLQAVATLQAVLQSWIDDPEATDGLLELFAQVESWSDLLAAGGHSADKTAEHLVALAVRLGEVCRIKLGDAPGAIKWYSRALAVQPEALSARDGLTGLLPDAATRPAAVEALVRACQTAEDWAKLLGLLPHRLELASDDRARLRLLSEAAHLAESKAGRPDEALTHWCAAMRLAPDDGHIEAEILRLAGDLATWPLVTETLNAAAAALSPSLNRTVHLRLLLARLLEQKMSDKKGALAAYQAALKGAPDNRQARAAVIRLAADTGAWELAADTAMAEPLSPDRLLSEHLPIVEKIASSSSKSSAAFAALGNALSAALARRQGLPGGFARVVEERVAGYKVPDEGWSEQALTRALAFDPNHLPTLRALAKAQRARGGRPLFDTLLKVAALTPRDLDPLADAADMAERNLRDSDAIRRCLSNLYDRSVQLLRGEGKAEGTLQPVDGVLKAVEGLVGGMMAGKDEAETRRAMDLLLGTARLPLPADKQRELRNRAGQMALETDKALARDIYRRTLDERPDDRETMAALAKLYEEAEQHSELLALRRRQLELQPEGEARMALRLEISRLGEVVESRSGRLEILLANLEEIPGHRDTLLALGQFLRSRGRQSELADVLTMQARRLESSGDKASAVRLWAEVASLAETPLADINRAIASWERVVALENSPLALDNLARLCAASDEPLLAAQWLEQRMSLGAPSERRPAAVRLARAYMAAGQRQRAVASLERALAEDPAADELWVLLIELYREGERWEALVRALSERCAQLEDPEVVMACAHEALAIANEQLHNPGRAVPILVRALTLNPGDRNLRLALADGLRAAGNLAEARGVLERVLEEYGRRQSRERAGLHYQVAQVARAEKNPTMALQNLEQAAAVLLDNMEVQLALAETAEEVGDIDRADKAYRALLVLARRGQAADAVITAGEVSLRLRRVAMAQGRKEAAAQFLDSALMRALSDAVEARRVQAALLAAGEGEVLLGLLEKRRAAATLPAEEALVVCELAQSLDKLGRPAEALEALLKIVAKVPDNVAAHAQARSLSLKLGQSARYLEAITGASEQLRRANDAPRLADLLLRAGEVAEQDLRDTTRASALYHRVEQTGSRVAEALTGLAHVGLRTGDETEPRRAAALLRKMAHQAESDEAKADLLFRVAECQLGVPSLRNEGLEILARAVDLSPDLSRAMALVEAAHVPESDLARVMPVYEKVARASTDEHVLLDFYERRAALPGARSEDVRDGVELAVSLGEHDRAEKLLERAVELAAKVEGGLRDTIWAILDLVRRLRARGDFEGVTRVLETAREVWANPRLAPVVREMANAAAEHKESASAAVKILEHLRVANPLDREAWEPLLHLYAKLDNATALQTLARELGEKLLTRTDRNAVRMVWASYLMTGKRSEERSIAVLREVLAEEPAHSEALMLLADLHERRGEVDRALAIVCDALASNEGGSGAAGKVEQARRLEDLVRKVSGRDAKKIYRQVLAGPLTDAQVKRTLQLSFLALLTGQDEQAERAQVSEALLAEESGEEAVARARTLAELRTHLRDEAGLRRALELGHARCPEDVDLFQQLAGYYSGHELWAELVGLWVAEADRLEDSEKAGELLRQAARLQREKLHDEPGAARSLRKAMETSPGDLDALRELTRSLVSAGDTAAARGAVSDALAADAKGARPQLLQLRAELAVSAGDEAAAVRDMEEALTLGANDILPALNQALSRHSAQAAAAGDTETARSATLRLAELAQASGDLAQSEQILFQWVDANPADHDVLQVMRERFEAQERWEACGKVWARLAQIEQGEAKAQAVLAMAAAWEKLDRGTEAIAQLKDVLAHMPKHVEVRARLAQLLASAGNAIEAAQLHIEMAEEEVDEAERYRLLVRAAETLLSAGGFTAAVQALEKATALRPTERQARGLLVDACVGIGDLDRATELLNGLLGEAKSVRAEELAVLYQRQARLAAAKGDNEGRLQALRKALDTDRKSTSIATEVADLAEAVGDDELAMRALRVVTASPNKDPKASALAYYRLGKIAHKAHDKARAIIFVKRALQEDPDLAEAHKLLDELK
jgi:tetratricopeptide (TPR) repeat protein